MIDRADLKRKLHVAAGFFFLVLGGLGVVLPILPTTPFLLLAAAMFLRSSGRMYQWLTAHRLFGPFIRNYRLYRAVPLRTKVTALIFLYLTIGYSVFFVLEHWWLRVGLLGIAAWATWHIVSLRTLTAEMRADIERREGSNALPVADVEPEPLQD